MIRWVCFDVGETLFDETGYWGRWADYLGLPRPVFLAELRTTIAARRHHRDVFEAFRPGFDVDAAVVERQQAGDTPGFQPSDLFADVRPCLDALHRAGLHIGVAGNNTALTEQAVRSCGLPLSFIASSSHWQAAKPDARFFASLARQCAAPPAEIAYVGDRIDNDVEPAEAAGMTAVWLRRGLWAEAQSSSHDAASVTHSIDSLAELPPLLACISVRQS